MCLFNSFNFDFRRLRRFARRGGARMVHRVDGPIGAYRGFDDGTDARIAEINAALASTTIFQSEFSLAKHRELGFELREPVVIPNAVDPAIFHPPASREPLAGRRIRVVASSWSDNPRKGVGALEWLDRNLDLDRFELTFAGRPPTAGFERIRVVGPLDSSRAGRAAAHAGPLRRTQLGRPVLERPAGSARLRTAGRLPRQRRSSGARPRSRRPLPRGRRRRCRDRAARPRRSTRDGLRSRLAPSSWVADRYLEILGVRADP